ncbi:MAG: tetratricopeptide repeat protein [Alphaproteobacteria bacterium]|nr:tetratricopeptide repeat protein [Alphaproteobacteria bacterium]
MVSNTNLSISQAIALGKQHHSAGDLQKAHDIYRQVLQADPKQAEALHYLGLVAYQVGKPEDAVGLITKALALDENVAEAHNHLGLCLHSVGRLDQAVASFRKAIEVDPEFAEAFSNLASVFNDQGDVDEAVANYRRALQLNPKSALTYYNFAAALNDAGRFEEAGENYRIALTINPSFAEAHNNLGGVYMNLRHVDEAEACYRKAIEIQPEFSEAHNNLGNACREKGWLDEAVENYQKSILLDPEFSEAYRNLGSVYKDQSKISNAVDAYNTAIKLNPEGAEACTNLGELYELVSQLDEAEACFENALAISPGYPNATIGLSVIKRRRGETQQAIDLLEGIPEEDLSVTNGYRVRFELGKLYDLLGKTDEAFNHLVQGNRLQFDSRATNVRPEEYVELIDSIAKTTTTALAVAIQSKDVSKEFETPVFLVGFPRSGTTLLDQILDSHPRLQVMEERPALDSAVAEIGGYPDAIANLSDDDLYSLRSQYFEVVDQYMDRKADTILVDKLPLNIIHTALIAKLFPDARIILAMRHPCDVVLSNFMQMFQLNNAMGNFYSVGQASKLYDRVMGLWLRSAELLPLNVHLSRYEDLVLDVEGSAHSLLEFLDVGWDDAVLDHTAHARQRGKINTPSYSQVTEPIYQRARFRWLRYESQLSAVLDVLEPYAIAFGYPKFSEI